MPRKKPPIERLSIKTQLDVNNEISISFTIRGYEDISHDDISDSLGLVPYKVYVKGEPMSPRSPREAKNNGWIYRVDYGKLRLFMTKTPSKIN